MRCACAKFNQLPTIPVGPGAGSSYRIKGKMYRACVQSALTYRTETWAMKVGNLHSLERTGHMMVRYIGRNCT